MERSLSLRAKHDVYTDARKFYFAGTYTQTEISELTGVPRRTLCCWIKDGHWQQLRQNANQVPALILENFIEQLTGVQKQILARDESARVPTHIEAETQRKLLNAIINVKDYPGSIFRSLAETMHPISDITFSTESGDTDAAGITEDTLQ